MLGTAETEQYYQPDNAGLALLKPAIEKLNLLAGAYHRILQVARTIADLGHAANIQPEHIAEAIKYRRHVMRC